MKNHKLLVCLLAVIPSLSFAQGSLENPVAGSTESGIGAISGWHCTAKNIEVTIDGKSLGKAGSGTGRGDTTSICGRTDTGYSLLFNYNDLTPGSHSISAFGDGQLLETKQFNTIQSGGSAFVTGLSKTATVSDFPSSGKTATLQWSQAKQNFIITGISEIGGGGGGADDLSSLEGSYTQTMSASVSGVLCAINGSFDGFFPLDAKVTTTVNAIAIKTNDGRCTFNLLKVSGNSTSGFNLSGSGGCGVLGSNMTATNLKKVNNKLQGILTQLASGCTTVFTLL